MVAGRKVRPRPSLTPIHSSQNQTMPGPTTSTALDLIIGGLRNINALEAGETPQGNDASDALQVLNDLLDSLSTDKLFIYSPVENILSWTPGQFSYTIGNPTQGTFTGYTVSGYTLITGITNPSGLTITFGVGAGNVTAGGTLTDVQSAIPAGTTIVSLNTGAVTNITFSVAPTGTTGTFTSWSGGAVTGLITFSDNETRTATVSIGGVATWSPALTGTPTTSAQINTTTMTMSAAATATQTSADSITYTAPGNFAIQRPLRIRQGFTRITSSGNLGLDYYFDCQNSIDNYNQIGYKGVSGPWPKYAAYQPAFPYGSLRIYPNPSQAGEVHLWTDLILSNLTTVNQTFSLPQGYARALKKLLAIELAPEYGKNPSAELLRQAWAAKNDLKTLNETPVVQMNYDSALNYPSGKDAGWVMHGGFT